MDSPLFDSARFSSARSSVSLPVSCQFYYKEEVLESRLTCPVIYEPVFATMVTAMGAKRTGDNAARSMQATVAYYHTTSKKGLRQTIAQYRALLEPFLPSGLAPVDYFYASPPDTSDGIVFKEARLGHFEVIAILDCPDATETYPKWCDAALKTGLVTAIRAGSVTGNFVLTLAAHAQAEDRRLATYETLAEPFARLTAWSPNS